MSNLGKNYHDTKRFDRIWLEISWIVGGLHQPVVTYQVLRQTITSPGDGSSECYMSCGSSDRPQVLGPFYQDGLTLIPAHISNQVCDEITYPFPNMNGCTVEAWEWTSNFVPHFLGMDKWYLPTLLNGCNYLSTMGIELIHVSKRGPCYHN